MALAKSERKRERERERERRCYGLSFTYKPLVIYKWSMRTSAEFKAIHLNITDKIIIIHIINGLIRVPHSCPDIFATFRLTHFSEFSDLAFTDGTYILSSPTFFLSSKNKLVIKKSGLRSIISQH